jgi:DNA-binding beta-propeller fold protein YncE
VHKLNPRSLVVLLCTLALPGGVLACAGSAWASRGHVFETSFSEPCAAEPCEGSLKEPSGVAVDEATGDVYVVDKGANRVAHFDKSGTYLSELNGSGLLFSEGIEAGSGGHAGESGGTGELPGERGEPTGRFSEPEGIAVDNSCKLRGLSEETEPTCAQADPSNGDVYVVDAGFGHRVIDKYDAEGKYLGQITAGSESFQGHPLAGVAVDPEGAVWVYREPQVIDGFTNGAPNTFSEAIQIGGQGLGFPLPGFAVDAEGDFYARHTRGEDVVGGAVSKLDHTGKVLIEEVDEEPSPAVSVEQSNDNSVIGNLTSVSVFNAAGGELERLGAGLLGKGAGIGVNAGAVKLYVADAGSDTVLVFGPEPAKAPRVEDESISDVTSTSADLAGEVNPRSEANEAPTEYRFQYGACATPSTCQDSGYEASAPVPDGQLPPDFEVHTLSAHVQGLSPNTTYHFRLLARNSHGEGEAGEERVFRTQSAGGALELPDGRGWELVSPPDKQGSLIEPISEFGVVQAAGGGGAITYLANAPTEAQPQGYTNQVQVLSRRARDAWSSRDIAIAHAGATGLAFGPGPEYKFFDPELSTSAVQPFGEFIAALSGEASESTAYLHELGDSCASSCFHPLVSGKPGFANVPEGTRFGEEERCTPSLGNTAAVVCGPAFVGATEDLSHVVLSSRVALKEGAGGEQLYEWAGGALSQVSVLPGGEAAAQGEAELGLENVAMRRAISTDGGRIVWSTRPNVSLYLRDMARGETLQLDGAQAGCGSCESGGGRFQIASSDGTRIFFTDTRRLSEDSGAEPSGTHVKADLYECAITLEEEKLHCTLTDLTPKQGEEGAAVQGAVLGASEDGAYVYFIARGVLSEGQNALAQSASAGEANLYVRHGASTSFIATLADGDNHDWSEELASQPARVSENGRWLALMSEARPTGYDNRDVATGKPVAEVYLYDAGANRLSCASCEPSGGRPRGVEAVRLHPPPGLANAPWPSAALVAANVPGWTSIGAGGKQGHQPRYLSDSGRLFFNSADALVSQDSNGTEDVYQYEPPGVGDCTSSSAGFGDRSGGCVSLISSGASAQESAFMDASESGDDVFFLTAAKLSPLDLDAALDIYDAHRCTGALPCIVFPEVNPPPCNNEASCKASPTPQPSIFGAPASASFSGPGNPPPAPPAPAKVKTPEEIRIEKLNKALKACHAKKIKKKRRACEKAARRKYGAKPLKHGRKKGKARVTGVRK